MINSGNAFCVFSYKATKMIFWHKFVSPECKYWVLSLHPTASEKWCTIHDHRSSELSLVIRMPTFECKIFVLAVIIGSIGWKFQETSFHAVLLLRFWKFYCRPEYHLGPFASSLKHFWFYLCVEELIFGPLCTAIQLSADSPWCLSCTLLYLQWSMLHIFSYPQIICDEGSSSK